jgi:hypothetical protein
MKTIILSFSLLLLGFASFSQEETNGTIYIKHPYIDVVNAAQKAYLAKDDATSMRLYSDTAKFWYSGMDKPVSLTEAMKGWDSDFDYFNNIQFKTVGYPDYLHYKLGDAKIVQSWWTWTGVSKKTGKTIKVDMVLFDWFNNDGKIATEVGYGNFDDYNKEKM